MTAVEAAVREESDLAYATQVVRDVALLVGHLAANIPDEPKHPTDYLAMLAGAAKDGAVRVWEVQRDLFTRTDDERDVESALAELLWDLGLIHAVAAMGGQPNPDESNPLISGGWSYSAARHIGRGMPAKYGHIWTEEAVTA
jgi:hypothetical protein